MHRYAELLVLVKGCPGWYPHRPGPPARIRTDGESRLPAGVGRTGAALAAVQLWMKVAVVSGLFFF